MNRSQRKWSRLVRGPKRRAVVMIVAGIGLPCALVLCGLVIDVGNVCVARAELGRSADAAALASTAALLPDPKIALNGWTPDPTVLANQAWEEAQAYVLANPCRDVDMELPQNDIFFTHYRHDEHDPNLSEFILNSSQYNSTKVTVRRDAQQNGPIPLFFGGLVGLPSINARGESAAFLERDFEGFGIQPGSTATSKLLPFSLWEGLDEYGNLVVDKHGNPVGGWEARALLGNDEFTHNSENQTVSRGGDGIYEIRLFPEKNKDIPGNFGTVDIGNPNNSTADLRRQILHGPNAYDFSFFPNNEVKISEIDHEYPVNPNFPEGRKVLLLNGDTGISAAIKDDLEQIIGQPRILPIHWKAIGNGNNAWFRVVKFVGVTIVDVKLTGALRDKYIKIQPCYTVDGTALGGGRDGETSEYMYKPPRLRRIKDGK